MKRFVICLFFSLCMAAAAHAAPGYCHDCSCNRFNRDYYKGSGSEWYCRCGHSWDRHNFADRRNSVSFNGNVSTRSGSGKWIATGVVAGALLVVFAFVKFGKRIKDCWTRDDTTKSLGVVLIIVGLALIPTGVCIPVSIALFYAGRKLFSDGHL